jgi:MoaA/NifB/PqqE/SkfB family radical SAM enzyme
MLSKETISRYNAARPNTNKSILCHAPFVNINFEQNGNMTACCFNRKHVLGTYPESGIMKAWTGKKAEELREYMVANDLSGGCGGCEILIESGSYYSSRSLSFDYYAQPESSMQKLRNTFLPKSNPAKNFPAFPKSIELEISNVCNLECEMCDGYFSSTIRKNREQKPPLENPYDDKFVEQLAELIPHLKEMKFLGGEPFMIDIYYKIWDKILEINPGLRVNITTNGTVMNNRVRDLLQRLNCGVTVSLDSLTADTYEKIRVRAKFNQVMTNVNEMMDVLRAKGSALSIAICPMVSNWMELPDLVEFANKNNLHTFYNTVWHPEHMSVRLQKPKVIKKITETLSAHSFSPNTDLHRLNISRYNDVVHTFSYWYQHSAELYGGRATFLDSRYDDFIKHLPSGGAERDIVLLVLREHMDVMDIELDKDVALFVEKNLSPIYAPDEPLKQSLLTLSANYSQQEYLLANNEALVALAKIGFSDKIDLPGFSEKINMINQKIKSANNYEILMNRVISGHPVKQVLSIDRRPVEELSTKMD